MSYGTKHVCHETGLTQQQLWEMIADGKLEPEDNGKEGRMRRYVWEQTDIDMALAAKAAAVPVPDAAPEQVATTGPAPRPAADRIIARCLVLIGQVGGCTPRMTLEGRALARAIGEELDGVDR